MAHHHIVEQGEYLSGIARKYGFRDRMTIWTHPQNTDLRTRRDDPNVLFPGDELFIPDKLRKNIPAVVDRVHLFSLKNELLRLRLVLEDQYEVPIAHAACRLQVDGRTLALTTDGDGRLDVAIDAGIESAMLVIEDAKTAIANVQVPIRIGHLDPVDKVSGQRERLNNLGYFAGPFPSQTEDESISSFLSALEEFQCDHGLTVDGLCGAETQAKLKQVHGA